MDCFIYSSTILAIIFNTSVIVLALRFVKFKIRLEQIFVLNMTIADLIFSLIFIPIRLFLYLPDWFAQIIVVLVWLSSGGSVAFLLLVNIHKIVTLFYPLHSSIFVTRHRILAQIVICWTILLLISMVYSTQAVFVKEFGVGSSHPILYASMLMTFYILPLISSFLLSTTIFLLAQKKVRIRNNTAIEKRKVFKRIFFVFSSTIWTTSTCLPIRLTVLSSQLCRLFLKISDIEINNNAAGSKKLISLTMNATSNYKEDKISSQNLLNEIIYNTCVLNFAPAVRVFLVLSVLGLVGNPVITVLTQKIYRKRVNCVKC